MVSQVWHQFKPFFEYDSQFRSLSEVPKGLRPIRTTSGRVTGVTSEDDSQLKGFAARLRWARQQCLRQSGNPQAAHPTPARVSCPGLPAMSFFSIPKCLVSFRYVIPTLEI